MAVAQNLTLGSGKLYVKALTDETTLGSLTTYCTDANHVGWIKGGATITYTPSTYDVKDDMGAIYEHFITSESVKFSAGLLTWNKDVIQTLVNNETVTTTPATQSVGAITNIEIGANGFTTMDKYIVVFEAKADSKGCIRRFGLIGTSDAGLNLSYKPESETSINLNFTACAYGTEHKLLRIEEQAPLST